MAEKEERILIKKQINYHPPYGGWCGDGKEIVLTRQEAIERMEKAMKQYAKDEEIYTDKDLAIVALNALLDGK